MNESQKKVSRAIRALCKKHAYETQFDFKLIATDYHDMYGRRMALCEMGVVTICGGAIIDNWREFPTEVLRKLLENAKSNINKRRLMTPSAK